MALRPLIAFALPAGLCEQTFVASDLAVPHSQGTGTVDIVPVAGVGPVPLMLAATTYIIAVGTCPRCVAGGFLAGARGMQEREANQRICYRHLVIFTTWRRGGIQRARELWITDIVWRLKNRQGKV